MHPLRALCCHCRAHTLSSFPLHTLLFARSLSSTSSLSFSLPSLTRTNHSLSSLSSLSSSPPFSLRAHSLSLIHPLSPPLSSLTFRSYAKKSAKPPPSPPPAQKVKGGIRDTTPSSSSNPAKRTNRHGEGDPLRPVITFSEITKVVGGRTLLDQVSGAIHYGAKVGILGINGAGKSTFLKILAGVDDEFDGNLNFEPNLKIGYLRQEPVLPENYTGLPLPPPLYLTDIYTHIPMRLHTHSLGCDPQRDR